MFEEEENVWGAPMSSSLMNAPIPAFAEDDNNPAQSSFGPDEPEAGEERPPWLVTDEPEEMPWSNETSSSPVMPQQSNPNTAENSVYSSPAVPGGFPGQQQQQQTTDEETDAFEDASEQQPAVRQTQVQDQGQEEQDDFDDFGEFGGEDNDDEDGFGDFEESAPVPAPIPSTSSTYPLDLSGDVFAQTRAILSTAIPSAADTPQLTSNPERDHFGTLDQILLTPSSKALYESLVKAPTEASVFQWKRSATRQAYFKALDLPLDIEAESAKLGNRPSDHLRPSSSSTTRPSSPVVPHPTSQAARSAPVSRAQSPALPPPLDRSKAQALISMSREEMQSAPMDKLREIQEMLEQMIKVASAQLTHSMDQQEKLASDAETYDQMIQDLVSTAQKIKPAASSTVSMNSGSNLKRAESMPKARTSGFWSRRTKSPQPPPNGQSALRKASLPQ